MKKIKILLLCVVLLVSALAFTGCGDKYASLKNKLIEWQQKSTEDSDYITVKGAICNSSGGKRNETAQFKLKNYIVTENALITNLAENSNRYVLFIDIETITDQNDKIIWSK